MVAHAHPRRAAARTVRVSEDLARRHSRSLWLALEGAAGHAAARTVLKERHVDHIERTVNTLRDVVQRQRCGLPLPANIEINQLLEDAADAIEELQRDLENAEVPW